MTFRRHTRQTKAGVPTQGGHFSCRRASPIINLCSTLPSARAMWISPNTTAPVPILI